MRSRDVQNMRAEAPGGLSRIRSVCGQLSALLGMLMMVLGSAATVSAAGPLDLQNPTPRWVEVRFEISPANRPGQLDSEWSGSRAAYVDPRAAEGIVEVRIPAEEIEAHLRSTGTDAIPGTFSEFVWTFDRETGHVLAAQMQGRVRERVKLGFIQTSATIDIKVDMTTQQTAGFASESGMLGIETQRFCAPGPVRAGSRIKRSRRIKGCVGVEAAPLDPDRGYVNAVGTVRAATAVVEIEAFSPLGEARFSERALPPNQVVPAAYSRTAVVSGVVSGVSHTDAVCSSGFDGRCLADDLGGES
ncbi:MAG: hypothetical protein AB8G23_15790 [Myxococcota bacterium]